MIYYSCYPLQLFLSIVSIIMHEHFNAFSGHQADNNDLPSYKNLEHNSHRIWTAQKIYYYCVCQKKGKIFYDDIVLVLCQEINKPITTIYYILTKQKLEQSIKDLTILKRYNGIEITIIKSFEARTLYKILFQFAIKEQQEWRIRFKTLQMRNLWLRIIKQKSIEINQKTQLLKQKYQQKKEKEKERQNKEKKVNTEQKCLNSIANMPTKKQQIQFTRNQNINSLINTVLHNVKTIIKSRLADSSIDETDKSQFLDDKVNMFIGNFQILGHLTNDLLQNISSLQKKIVSLQSNQVEMQQLRGQNKHLQEISSRLEAQKRVYEEEKRKIQENAIFLEKERRKLSDNSESLKEEIDNLSKKSESLWKQKENQRETMMSEYENKLRECRINQQILKAELQKSQQENSSMKMKITQIKQHTSLQMESRERQISQIKMEVEKLRQIQQQRCSLLNQYETMKAQVQQCKLELLFQGELLRNSHTNKKYIKQTIQSYRFKQIASTRLLYAYDKQNKVNFHHYIDYHPNIVIIARTVKGAVIAGYSKDAFSPTATSYSSCGIIMSLTNKKSFYVIENKRSISYDEYYSIFGNSEIRIKSQEETIFSNFGIANSYYNSNGFRVDVLLGENTEREVPLETYQFYQIKFKDEQL